MFVKPVWLVYNGFICLSDCQNEVETLPRSGKAIKTIKILHCHQISPQSFIAAVFQKSSFITFFSCNHINLEKQREAAGNQL